MSQKDQEESSDVESLDSDEEAEMQIPKESNISQTLSSQTTRTVVMLVLCLLFLLPVCTADTYLSGNKFHDAGLK